MHTIQACSEDLSNIVSRRPQPLEMRALPVKRVKTAYTCLEKLNQPVDKTGKPWRSTMSAS